jgi:hypothetical protein
LFKAKALFIVAIVLCLATPAAVEAAGRSPLDATATRNTALGRNLLRNASFEQTDEKVAIPAWKVVGAMHLERFGSRTWPSVAYSKKYDGGDDYLACSAGPGLIRQTVDFTGWRPRDYRLKAHFAANFGGTIENRIRAAILITGRAGHVSHRERIRTLDITNSYKKITVTLLTPEWADHITVTLQLMPKPGVAKCDVVTDTLSLTVFRP